MGSRRIGHDWETFTFTFTYRRRQGLADQAPPLPSPASHHRFCPSHTDPAWPVSLEYHALSHFLTVLAPTLFHRLHSHSCWSVPRFQLWTGSPSSVIPWCALCPSLMLLLCQRQENRAWICLVFSIHHGQPGITTQSSDLKFIERISEQMCPPLPCSWDSRPRRLLLISPQVTEVPVVLMPLGRVSSYWCGPPTTWGNLYIHLFHQQTFVLGMFWVLEEDQRWVKHIEVQTKMSS